MDAPEFIKPCSKCHVPQTCSPTAERSAFYVRSGITEPTDRSHYNSHCKTCMKAQQHDAIGIPLTEPRAASEKVAIAYLRGNHIHVLPGKALGAADVDVVAWGCVWIEVKWAALSWHSGKQGFMFKATPRQRQRGFLAHLVMLMCEYPDGNMTHHLFEASNPVFYINGHIKTGLHYAVGLQQATKHGHNRVVMTQPMMNNALDRLELIEQSRLQISSAL